MSNTFVRYPASSGGGGGVSSLNSLTGALTLIAGSGITITPSGSNITIASSGGSGANTTLSNLTATVAANQNIDPDSSFTRDLGGGNAWAFIGGNDLAVSRSDFSEYFDFASLATDGTLGPVSNLSGEIIGSGTGSFSLFPGGSLVLACGNNAHQGDVVIYTNSLSSPRGHLIIQDGSEGTSGQVWTSLDTNGKGHWAAPSAPAATGARVTIIDSSASPGDFSQCMFDTTVYDTGGYASGSTFVAPADGLYLLQARAFISSPNDEDYIVFSYSVNSTSAQTEFGFIESGGAATPLRMQCANDTLKLSSGDIVRIFYLSSQGLLGQHASITKF